MSRIFCALIGVVLSVTSGVLPASTNSPGVHDQGGFFSPQAIQQADAKIDQIRQKTGKDMVVLTFPGLPDDLRSRYDASNKQVFFQTWADREAANLKVNGVMLLLNKDPRHFEVWVGQNTARREFTLSDRSELMRQLQPLLAGGRYDQALLAAIDFVEQAMAGHDAALRERAQSASGREGAVSPGAPDAPPAAGRGVGWSAWSCLLVAGAIIIGIMLLRRMMASRQTSVGGYGGGPGPGGVGYGQGPQGPLQGGYGTGGGGFGRGMFGGLLGGMAGGWLYDKMRGRSSPPAGQGGFGGGGSTLPPDAPSADDAGLGSSQGGDFGGGDSGGGDAGGGGSDSGGDF